jgi:succinate dehydrogenase/fumarate reductase cytochrome b subunit
MTYIKLKIENIKFNFQHIIIGILFLYLSFVQYVFAAGEGSLQNPLAFNSIAEFVSKALQALVVIALPIVGFFILLSGFLFISARGNQEKLSRAKTNFMWVIAGAILILGAWALSQLIGGTIEQLRA